MATVTITVDPVNDKPVCSGLTLSTNKNVAISGNVSCTDPENDPLTLRISISPNSGDVTSFDSGTGEIPLLHARP